MSTAYNHLTNLAHLFFFKKASIFVQNEESPFEETATQPTQILPDLEQAIDIEIGSRIRQHRRGVGLTQKDLAAKLGMKYQVIQKYEKATTRVSISRLIAIAKILGVDPKVFFEGLTPWELARSNRSADFHNTNTAIDMSRALSELPPPTQRAIVNMVRELSAEKD